MLIGGAGKDDLSGRGGDDLLIGGTTAYDDSVSQLAALFAAWTSTAAYADRVAQIASESFSASLELNETVFDDQIADEIFGGDGQDWFFLTGAVEIYDPNLSAHTHGAATAGAMDDGDGHSHAGAMVVDHIPALEGFAFVDSLDKIGDRQSNESLHSLIPHADSPSLQREHLTLSQLVRYDQVTNYAVASGAWSSPSTWSNGVVPASGARVLIPIGVKVTVDRVITARLATVRVDGTLSFSTTANSELRVDTIVVTNVGRYEMGTVAAPIPAGITSRLLIIDNGPINRAVDPFAIGRGLISHGSVSMYGAAVTSRMAIAGAAYAGNVTLTMKSTPIGWKIGDNIVLASTVAGTTQNEVRRIVGIAGTLVVLDRPLSYNHVPAAAGLTIHTINTTRNVSISSENTALDRRGHVMFMHNRDVHIANAGFYELGRTDKSQPINDPVVDANWQLQPGTGTNPRARYSVHFHRTGSVEDGNPSTVTGSVVVGSPGWGYVNHSSYVDIVDNVAFDVHGAAFATEVGDEIGSFRGNTAIGGVGSGEAVESRLYLQDFGHQGDGFWFQGTGITVTANIAAGNDGNAFIVFARGLKFNGVEGRFLSSNLPDPSIADGDDHIDVGAVPMLQFSNNFGYASATGLSVWYHLEKATQGQQGQFIDSTFWNNDAGIDIPYTHDTLLKNLTVIRNAADKSGIGVGSNVVTRNIVFQNLVVSGYARGIVMPRQGTSYVIGGSYNNYFDFQVLTAVKSDREIYFSGAIQFTRLVMDSNYVRYAGSVDRAFLDDRVFLDFGPYSNRRLYYDVQAPDAIPFPTARAGVPAAYIGLTSQQLKSIYGVTIGGQLAPAGSTIVPSIEGLIGPAA